MSQKFSHKEFLLLLGVVVALLVIFILWFNQTPSAQSFLQLEKSGITRQLIPPLNKSFVEKAMVELSGIMLRN